MGDRGNIAIESGYGELRIYLYSHWHGSALLDILQDALERGRPRWNDAPYLSRIIFCEMLKYDPEGLDGLLSFGISPHPGGGSTIVVNVGEQVVLAGGARWTFEEFVERP